MKRGGRKKKPKKITLPHVEMAVINVDNPLYSADHPETGDNPRRIRAQFNMRESYAGLLYGRHAIDAAQWEAAGIIRRAYEAMGGAGARAIDYERPYVDGGQITQPIVDRHLEASAKLHEALKALGPEGYNLTLRLAGEGQTPKDLSPVESRQRYFRERFKECLNTLAVLWGKKLREKDVLHG